MLYRIVVKMNGGHYVLRKPNQFQFIEVKSPYQIDLDKEYLFDGLKSAQLFLFKNENIRPNTYSGRIGKIEEVEILTVRRRKPKAMVSSREFFLLIKESLSNSDVYVSIDFEGNITIVNKEEYSKGKLFANYPVVFKIDPDSIGLPEYKEENDCLESYFLLYKHLLYYWSLHLETNKFFIISELDGSIEELEVLDLQSKICSIYETLGKGDI